MFSIFEVVICLLCFYRFYCFMLCHFCLLIFIVFIFPYFRANSLNKEFRLFPQLVFKRKIEIQFFLILIEFAFSTMIFRKKILNFNIFVEQ